VQHSQTLYQKYLKHISNTEFQTCHKFKIHIFVIILALGEASALSIDILERLGSSLSKKEVSSNKAILMICMGKSAPVRQSDKGLEKSQKSASMIVLHSADQGPLKVSYKISSCD